MSKLRRRMRVIGFVLHVLIGGLTIAAGAAHLLGLAPPERAERMGLTDSIRLVGAGEIITAILLLTPRTLSPGVLLTSAFWGGAICVHMTHGESYLLQTTLLVASWVGAYLRDPAVLNSLGGGEKKTESSGVEGDVAGSSATG
jgi:hypothetical protein